MEELQNYIWELGMRKAIYKSPLESPDLVKFTVEMTDLILQEAPSHHGGTLTVNFYHVVASEAIIQQTSQLLANLGENKFLSAQYSSNTEKVILISGNSSLKTPP